MEPMGSRLLLTRKSSQSIMPMPRAFTPLHRLLPSRQGRLSRKMSTRLASTPCHGRYRSGPSSRQDILKHGGYGGQGGKEQENEKQRAPELAARHGVEHIGQGHKDQAGALAGVDAESEGGGEDDQAGDKGNAGVTV